MATATAALLQAQTAYTTLQETCLQARWLPTNELGNLTLAPGTYTSASFYDITAGPLTLDAKGDPKRSGYSRWEPILPSARHPHLKASF